MGELEKKYKNIKDAVFCKEVKTVLYCRLYVKVVISCFVLMLIFTQTLHQVNATEQEPTKFDNSVLTIVTPHASHIFLVEVAISVFDRQQGLMGRRSMPQNWGMLFDFKHPQKVHMWMKNTNIPLDMLFIDEKGKIGAIAKNTVPHSTDIISSPHPARAVLELNAGTISRLNIKVGDRVIHQIFQR